MTPERIAELRRCNAMHFSTTTSGMRQTGWSAELTECLDEIERLQSLLEDSGELQSVADKIVDALEEFADKLDNLIPDE